MRICRDLYLLGSGIAHAIVCVITLDQIQSSLTSDIGNFQSTYTISAHLPHFPFLVSFSFVLNHLSLGPPKVHPWGASSSCPFLLWASVLVVLSPVRPPSVDQEQLAAAQKTQRDTSCAFAHVTPEILEIS